MRCPGHAITLAATGPEPLARSVNQVARVGRFEGHPQGGFEFTPDVFAQLVRNFAATANRRVPVDYEHASETLGGSVPQAGAPAVAWVTALDNRGPDGLFATFEWVDRDAVDAVRAGKYMYVSPAVVFHAVDRESGAEIGPRLTSVALTNHPFLDGMQPLAARVDGGSPAVASPTLASLSPDAVHVPSAIGAQPKKVQPMADLTQDGQDNRVMSMFKKLRAGLKLSDGASDDDVMSAFDHMLSEHDRLCAAQAAAMRADADAVVALRVDQGVVPADPKAREKAAALCLADRATFDVLFPAREKAAEPAAKPPTADEKTLLTNRVAPVVAPQETPRVEPPVDDDHSKAADALAVKLMGENAKLNYVQAATLASRQLKQAEVERVLATLAAGRRG